MNATLRQRACSLHEKLFGKPAVIVSAAPGRVNLIGEHVDYCDGLVLPMAINRTTLVAGSPSPNPSIQLHSRLYNETVEIPLRSPILPGQPTWANYARGVIKAGLNRGLPPTGWTAVIDSDIPSGSGLSSSAALEVAIAGFLEAVSGVHLDRKDKALLCRDAEHEFAGVPCGIMDQFASIFGEKDKLVLIDCRDRSVRWVFMEAPDTTALVINTNVRHELSDGEYARRRHECELAARTLKVRSLRDLKYSDLQTISSGLDPVLARRVKHVVSEIERTRAAVEAIESRSWDRLGELLRQSHRSLRDDFEVSCPELDLVFETCASIKQDDGMIGCRMTGGGFGGSCIALIQSSETDRISEKIASSFRSKTGREASFFITRPSAGASMLS